MIKQKVSIGNLNSRVSIFVYMALLKQTEKSSLQEGPKPTKKKMRPYFANIKKTI